MTNKSNGDLLSQTFAVLVNSFQKQNDSDVDFDVLSSLMHKHDNKIKFIQTIRENILLNYLSTSNSIDDKKNQVKTINELNLSICSVQCNLVRQRLNKQKLRSEKRLKELVFEIIGEYTKSHIRLHRRKEYLFNDSKVKIALEVWKLRWSRFCMKLSCDLFFSLNLRINLGQFHLHDIIRVRQLNTAHDSSELEAMLTKITKHIGLISDKNYHVMSVVKVTIHPKFRREDSQVKATQSAQNIRLAEYSTDLVGFTEDINAWLAMKSIQQQQPQQVSISRSTTPANGRRNSDTARNTSSNIVGYASSPIPQSSRQQLLLSASIVDWLHCSSFHRHIWNVISSRNDKTSQSVAASTDSSAYNEEVLNTFIPPYVLQHSTSLFNDRLYFCLESFAHSGNENSDYALFLKALTDSYITESSSTNDHTLSTLLSQSALEVTEMCGIHRLYTSNNVYTSNNQYVINALSSFPDVIRAKCVESGTVLHFAPASVYHLMPSNVVGGDKTFLSNTGVTDERNSSAVLSQYPQLFCLAHAKRFMNSSSGENVSGSQSPSKQSNAKIGHSDVFVIPLTNTAIDCLVKHYLPSSTTHSGTAATTTQSADASVSNVSSENVLSAFDLLPDHSRMRSTLGTNGSTRKKKLSYSYILFSDENVYCTNDQDLSAKTRTQPCYYCLQVQDSVIMNAMLKAQSPRGNNNNTTGVMLKRENSFFEEVTDCPYSELQMREDELHMRHLITHHNSVTFKCKLTLPVYRSNSTNTVTTRTDDSPVVHSSRKSPGNPNMHKTLLQSQSAKESVMTSSSQHTNRVEEGEGVSSPTKSGEKGDGWDPLILSNICRWRSCLCDAATPAQLATINTTQHTAETPRSRKTSETTSTLCVYHTQLKAFLDTKTYNKHKGSEVAKYLPRKAPNFSVLNNDSVVLDIDKRDRLTIRAASTLLQELWDSKLSQTVLTFTKKMAGNMCLSNYLHASQQLFEQSYPKHFMLRDVNRDGSAGTSLIPHAPSWAKWKNKENVQRVVQCQTDSLLLLENILQTEQHISQEIEALLQLNVFPSSELAIIRKEMKMFKESQDLVLSQSNMDTNVDDSNGRGTGSKSLSTNNGYDNLLIILRNEMKVCERKHSILAARRHEEEENHQSMLRKLARAKAQQMELNNQPASSMRDPLSFRNHENR